MKVEFGHTVPMQNVLSTFALVSALVLVVAAVVTVLAFRHAPEGHEDEQGFQFGPTPAPVAVEAATELGQVLLFNAAGATVPVTPQGAWAGRSQDESDRSIAA
jgi:hypothetical protein